MLTSDIKLAVFRWLWLVRTVGTHFASAFVSVYRTDVVVSSFVKIIVVRCMEMDMDIEWFMGKKHV